MRYKENSIFQKQFLIKKKMQIIDLKEDESLAYSNSCNWVCYSSDGFQAFS